MHERPRIPLRPRIRLRPPGGAAASAAVLATSLLLAGCTAASAPAPTPAPAPSLTQEQQDDAAFRDVFERYASLDPSGENEETLSGLLSGDALDGEVASVRDTQDKKQHSVGRATTSGFEVTSRGSDAQGDFMVGQACLDVSGIRILDASGNDVTPQRDARLSLQMKAMRSTDGTWRISDSLRNEAVHACG
ncbi:FlaG/FlaF family flagellin (archaellin) [Clavibacter michiganensis]|nr:FlaG/FlaF family flagellin (archaellin) [Clavibacter michiganensis]